MSGGGSGGNWPPDINEIPCNTLRFITGISSPQPPAIQTVQVNDVLQVEIRPFGSVQSVVVLKNGVIVGGLIGGKVNRLRDCLLNGSLFKGTVLSANGAQVQIEVEHV